MLGTEARGSKWQQIMLWCTCMSLHLSTPHLKDRIGSSVVKMLLLCRSQRASAEVVCKEAFPEPQRRIRLKLRLLIYSEQEDT